jgi:hypothetical protein
MAKPNLSKKKSKKKNPRAGAKGTHLWPGETPDSKGRGRHSVDYETWRARQPFDPLKNPYRTNAQFDAAVESQVQAQLNQLLTAHADTRSDAESAHTGRTGHITDMYNTGSQARQAALDRTIGALNNLTTLNSGLSGATRDAMAAALRGSQATADQVAAQLGVASTPGQGQAYQDATQAAIDLAGIGSAGNYAGLVGGLARDVGINEVSRGEATRAENSRWDALLADLNEEKEGIMGQAAGFRDTARNNLMTQSLAQSAQAEQQRLGRAQHDLNEDQFGEQKVQNREQRRIARRQQAEAERQGRRGARSDNRAQTETERANRANEAINAAQVEAQIQQYRDQADQEADAVEGEKLKAKAQRWENGVKIISDYFKPTKGETGKSGKTKSTYAARVTHGYDAMVQQLQAATGAGEIEVRQMILAAVNSGTPYGKRWTDRARREIQRIKNSRIKTTPKDPRNPSQSPMGPK